MNNNEKLYHFCRALLEELNVTADEFPSMPVYFYPTSEYILGEVEPGVAALLQGIHSIVKSMESEYEN